MLNLIIDICNSTQLLSLPLSLFSLRSFSLVFQSSLAGARSVAFRKFFVVFFLFSTTWNLVDEAAFFVKVFFSKVFSGFWNFFGRGLDRVHLIRATQLRQNVSTQTPQRTKYLYFARAWDKMSSQENYNLNCKNVQFCIIELNSKCHVWKKDECAVLLDCIQLTNLLSGF